MIGDQMITRRRLAILALSVATGCAIGQAIAPDAHADESSFINAVDNQGTPVNSALLGVGYNICSDASSYGTDGLKLEADAALQAGVTPHDSAVIIVESVYELCPSNMPALNAWLAEDKT